MRITSYELRATARTLAKHAGFTSVAVVSLGLAIGLNTTMYSTLDALINPKVSWREPGQLFGVGFYGDRRRQIDPREKIAMLRGVAEIEGITGTWNPDIDALLESDRAHRTGAIAVVAPSYFELLGVRARRGRTITQADVGASTPGIVLSERAARDLFPKSDALGQRLFVNGTAHSIVGVLPLNADAPASPIVGWRLPGDGVDVAAPPRTLVRLRSGVTVAQVMPALQGIAARIALQANEATRDNRVWFLSANPEQAHFGVFQYAVIGAVISVLLVACANIGNLQLARGIARGRELATRAALGASRRDLITHLLLESALLALAGLVLGLILTLWGMAAIRASIPPNIGEFFVEPQTSWRLFVVAAVSTVVCILIVGLVPAIRVSRVNLNELIKAGAGTGSTRSARRQYGILIVAEIGFALVVLCAAALLVRATIRLDLQAAAFDQSHLTSASTQVRLAPGQTMALADATAPLVSRLRALPDVGDVAVSYTIRDDDKILTATNPSGAMHTVAAPLWSYSVVTPSFFRTMGFEVSHGRDFKEGETGAVAIVDARTARIMWPNTEAVGHMIKFGAPGMPGRWYTVIGVRKPIGIESIESATLGETMPGAVYVLAVPEDRLLGKPVNSPWTLPRVNVVVRSTRNPHRAPIALRNALVNDTRFRVVFAGTFDERDGSATQRQNQRFVGAIFTFFAALAFVLAALGVYGIVSHSVAERRREIGVRIALGSSARDILYVVLREGNVFVLAGIAIGLFLIHRYAWMLTQFAGSFPEIDLHAIELFLPAAAFFFVAALISALVPALRATRIDPVESLRCE
jgi:putative ABC transport system permease protein